MTPGAFHRDLPRAGPRDGRRGGRGLFDPRAGGRVGRRTRRRHQPILRSLGRWIMWLWAQSGANWSQYQGIVGVCGLEFGREIRKKCALSVG